MVKCESFIVPFKVVFVWVWSWKLPDSMSGKTMWWHKGGRHTVTGNMLLIDVEKLWFMFPPVMFSKYIWLELLETFGAKLDLILFWWPLFMLFMALFLLVNGYLCSPWSVGAWGKHVIIGENCVLRPSYKKYKVGTWLASTRVTWDILKERNVQKDAAGKVNRHGAVLMNKYVEEAVEKSMNMPRSVILCTLVVQ